MNKKQFRVNDLVKFNYSEIGEYIDENHTDTPLRNDEVVDLLNEQQAKIERLEDENAKYHFNLSLAETKVKNREKKISEQQATISRLEEENEQLRKELNNFKPVLFQDMRKGTVILYSKGD